MSLSYPGRGSSERSVACCLQPPDTLVLWLSLTKERTMTAQDTPHVLPNGPAWAAVLAGGIGCAALGFIIDLAEWNTTVFKALSFYNPVGNLSGKSTLGILVWLVAWAILHAAWKNRTIANPGRILILTLILILLGIIATFPSFFSLFAVA
jgi:hypothetical protein